MFSMSRKREQKEDISDRGRCVRAHPGEMHGRTLQEPQTTMQVQKEGWGAIGKTSSSQEALSQLERIYRHSGSEMGGVGGPVT